VRVVLTASALPIARTPCSLTDEISTKVEHREGGVDGKSLSYRPPSLLPQRIENKVELREGDVDAQRLR
jgi:hypothetical protein